MCLTEVQFVRFSYETRISELRSFSSITSDLLDFRTKKKLSSIYRRMFLCLHKQSLVACNSVEAQTRKVLLLFGRDGLSGKILASV